MLIHIPDQLAKGLCISDLSHSFSSSQTHSSQDLRTSIILRVNAEAALNDISCRESNNNLIGFILQVSTQQARIDDNISGASLN